MKIIKNQNYVNYKLVKIEDIANIVRGGSPRPIEKYITKNPKDMPWLKIKDATSVSKYIEKTKEYIRHDGVKHSRVVQPGDFIVSNSATPGIPRIMKIQACIHDGWLLLNDIKINKDYLFYIFHTVKKSLENQGQGSIFKNLSKDILNNFQIKITENKDQQKKIAHVLSMQEEQIETIKRLIKNVEKRNQYYSEKLLSGELRLRKNEETGQVEFYENTEWKEEMVNGILTKIPFDWNAESLTQNNFIIKSGIRRFSGTKKYYATANIGQNFLDNDFEEVTFDNRPSRANFEPVKNSIWFAKMKGTCKNLLFKEENDTLLISSGMAGIQININRFDLNFMFHFIRSAYFNKLKDNLSQGGIQISINNDNINKIYFIYPENIYEQKKISFILNFYNDELKHLESLQKKEEKRFQWMLDNLLSGEYEVIDED